MKYNAIGKTGVGVSEIGLGCEYLEGKDYAAVEQTIHAALDAGINIFDIFMSEPQVRSNIGKALGTRRKDIYIQGHFRPVWKNGQYGRTLELDEVKYFFEDLLTRLNTDYIDFGMLHIMDSEAEYNTVFGGAILQYALQMKEQGVIRHLGFSSHIPETALKAVRTGMMDLMLFSINPVYDMLLEDMPRPMKLDGGFFDTLEHIGGINRVRDELYRTCETMGVGITVMKALGGGALLDERRSPFGKAMSVAQCTHYALNRPAVASVLIGMQSPDEIAEGARYSDLSNYEKDYTAILSLNPKFSLRGKCMYCNHCLPCPSNINVALVNKYLDLAELGDTVPPTVREHYDSLETSAQDCIKCGACESNCPFGVPIMQRMEVAGRLFGK